MSVVGEAESNLNLYQSVFYSYNYFKKCDAETAAAICLVCEAVEREKPPAKRRKIEKYTLKITDGNTKGMILFFNYCPCLFYMEFYLKGLQGHLSKCHPEQFKKYEAQKSEVEERKAKIKEDKISKKKKDSQPCLIAGADGNLAVVPRKDPEMQKRWDDAVVTFSSQTLISFRAMERSKTLLKAIWPNIKPKIEVRSHQTVSRHVKKRADTLRSEIFSIILSEKEHTKSFSFTTDLWTNRRLNSFLYLTIHFITEDMTLLKFVPWCEYFGKRGHTGMNIKLTLEDFLEAAELNGPEISKNVVLDSAANNKLAIRLSDEIVGFYCNIHTLQLAVKDAMKLTLGLVSLKIVFDKSQELAVFVRRSEKRNNELKSACEKTGTSYILPTKSIDVRWNSKADSLASVIKLKAAFQHLATKQDWKNMVLTGQEFRAAESLLKCPDPVKKV